MDGPSRWTRSRILTVAWAVVLLELLSPVPALLSLGTVYVLVARPVWFLRAVEELYRTE